MPEPTLNKILSKDTDIVALTFNKIADSPVALKVLYRAFTQNGSRGVFSTLKRTLKEMDAELKDEEAAEVSSRVISQIFGSGTQGDAYGSWRKEEDDDEDDDEEAVKALKNVVNGLAEKYFNTSPALTDFVKEFDDVLAQVSAPKGGSENFTNVSSPGMAPGKISAVPGVSGGYERRAQTIGDPRTRAQGTGATGFYDPTGSYSSDVYSRAGIAGSRSPNQRINSNTRGQDWEQVGPVGQRGKTDHVPSTSALKPGTVSPGQGSAPSQYKNLSRGAAIAKRLGLHLSKRKYGEEDFPYGDDKTPPPTAVPGDYTQPVGWSGSSDDQATQWSNDPSASPNQTIGAVGANELDYIDLFGEEETEEQRMAREESEELTRRSEELEGYARMADRQADEARGAGRFDESEELKSKAIQLRKSAVDLREKMKSHRTLLK